MGHVEPAAGSGTILTNIGIDLVTDDHESRIGREPVCEKGILSRNARQRRTADFKSAYCTPSDLQSIGRIARETVSDDPERCVVAQGFARVFKRCT
ncbi:MAG: hypothetical protein BWY95_02679 [Bacteroidetes bacterium ADurb.BinA104]|nr:MAG: hypothetical protein BWY95_02679 [Bacteroidetes bacterium ADurb.BinA104]